MNPALLDRVRMIERDDENPYFEIVDGAIVMQPQKTVVSSMIASKLAFRLGSLGKASESGYVVIRALYCLTKKPDLMRRPEVGYVSNERWPRSRCFSHEAIEWDAVPNLAIEIINPQDFAVTVVQKVDEYFRAGVELVWVVHPKQQQIYVYESTICVRILTEKDVLDGGKVLPQFRLPLKELFQD